MDSMRTLLPGAKMKSIVKVSSICMVVMQAAVFPFAESGFQPVKSQDLEIAMEQYIRTHPEVIAESLQAFEVKRANEERHRVKTAVGASSMGVPSWLWERGQFHMT